MVLLFHGCGQRYDWMASCYLSLLKGYTVLITSFDFHVAFFLFLILTL